MSPASGGPLQMPWLPPGHTMLLDGRGEVFYRHHRHADPTKPTVLLTRKAKRKAVLTQLRKAAKALKAGDLFFLSYSGHGGQVPDSSGDEPDRNDETWCLFDGQLLDDELRDLWAEFPAGARIACMKPPSALIALAAMDRASSPACSYIFSGVS